MKKRFLLCLVFSACWAVIGWQTSGVVSRQEFENRQLLAERNLNTQKLLLEEISRHYYQLAFALLRGLPEKGKRTPVVESLPMKDDGGALSLALVTLQNGRATPLRFVINQRVAAQVTPQWWQERLVSVPLSSISSRSHVLLRAQHPDGDVFIFGFPLGLPRGETATLLMTVWAKDVVSRLSPSVERFSAVGIDGTELFHGASGSVRAAIPSEWWKDGFENTHALRTQHAVLMGQQTSPLRVTIVSELTAPTTLAWLEDHPMGLAFVAFGAALPWLWLMTFGLRRKPQADTVRPTISQALEQSKDVFPLETLPPPAAPPEAPQVPAAKSARFHEMLTMPRVEKRDLTHLLTPRPFKEWLSQCLDALSSDLGRPLVLFRTRPLKRKLVACAFSRVDPRHCLALSVGLTGNDLFRELEEQARNREFIGQVECAFHIRSPLAFTLVDKDGAYGLLMVDQTRPMSPEEQTGVYPYLQILTLQLALEDARDRSRRPQVAPQVRT